MNFYPDTVQVYRRTPEISGGYRASDDYVWDNRMRQCSAQPIDSIEQVAGLGIRVDASQVRMIFPLESSGGIEVGDRIKAVNGRYSGSWFIAVAVNDWTTFGNLGHFEVICDEVLND